MRLNIIIQSWSMKNITLYSLDVCKESYNRIEEFYMIISKKYNTINITDDIMQCRDK